MRAYTEAQKTRYAEMARLWKASNPERTRRALLKWRASNPEQTREASRKYRARNPGYARERKTRDPVFKLAALIRTRLYLALKGTRKSQHTLELMGCTFDEARAHIEGLFQKGMTWANQGLWHIDHRRALATFDLSDLEQLKQACHYTNLQPLWASDNCSKGARNLPSVAQ